MGSECDLARSEIVLKSASQTFGPKDLSPTRIGQTMGGSGYGYSRLVFNPSGGGELRKVGHRHFLVVTRYPIDPYVCQRQWINGSSADLVQADRRKWSAPAEWQMF